MTNKFKPIVFFGSGPLAAKSLELLAQNFEIEAVITKSTPAHHKGDVPVVLVTRDLGIATFSADNRSQLDQIVEKHHFSSEVGILIDFGIIVSQKVIDSFKKGIINSHFSILPQWRGADPISFSLLSGQKTTGVSLMLLVEAMDEGPLLAFEEIEINSQATGESLSDQLIELSNKMLIKNVPLYLNDSLKPQPQSITGRVTSYSRKLTKEDGVIKWSEPAQDIENQIRAFQDWPKSHATLGGIDLVVTKAHVIPGNTDDPGNYTTKEGQLVVNCGVDRLVIDSLKPNGKPEMTSQAFLAGYQHRLS